jgi:membrane protein implicated in regulation of membrane protease activity
MFEIPVEDFIFVVCALVGGGLLLITVLVDDILGAVFDFDIGGVSLMPLLLAFISMFGVGGLFATQILDIHGGQAALIGTAFGGVGLLLVYLLFSAFRRSEGASPFSTQDLIGRDVFVAVGIPAGRFGSVHVKAEGQTHEFSATASVDIPQGAIVRVTGVAGTGLVVAPMQEPSTAATAPAEPTAGGSERA